MTLTESKRSSIKQVLKLSLKNKFNNYSPETKYMPFHHRLLGKDRMALFSFIQSLNTTFGTSIYEPVAVALATDRFSAASAQIKPATYISTNAHAKIQQIMDGIITSSREPDKLSEIEILRSVCRSGKMNKVKLTKVDIWLESKDGKIILIDMKTVKPNMGEFKGFKRTLLEWAAAELAKNPEVQIKTIIGIPYNPYEPEPYNRWTMKGMFDLTEEVLVAEELWEFIGGQDTYFELLDCFEEVGIELRSEIDAYFAKFNK